MPFSSLGFSPALLPLLLRALQSTAPLSVVMAERLTALRQWADGRTVNAG